MAKSKYDEIEFPKLAEKYSKDGLSNLQIAHNLGISEDTFYTYVKKRPEFSDALKKGRVIANQIVENALYKRAVGFEFEEKHTEVDVDSEGNPTIKKVKTIKKTIYSDRAAIFWLTNRDPEQWRQKKVIEHEGEHPFFQSVDETNEQLEEEKKENDEGAD